MDMHRCRSGILFNTGDELSASNMLVEAFRSIVEKDPTV